MTLTTETKSCGPQLLDTETPPRRWTLEQLTEAARAEHEAILDGERSTTASYWRLGQLLCLSRKHFGRGQWKGYLAELGIEKTRAAKAVRIFETFKTLKETEGLTVEQAYLHRKLLPRGSTRKRGAASEIHDTREPPSAATRTWSEFATTIVADAEQRLDEAEFLSPTEAAQALDEMARAREALRRLEERLKARCAAAPHAEQA